MRVWVEADGGSRGNPGPAGFGAVVFDGARTQVLAERSGFLGVATNNVAEYRGLIAGLTAAAELGAQDVSVRMDSKLVVEQMSGRWKVKHPDMIELAAQARQLRDRFTAVDFEWIPRERNSHADRLANEAMDTGGVEGDTDAGVEGDTDAGVEGDTDAGVDGTTDAGVEGDTDAGVESAATAGPGWTGASGAPTRLLLLRHGQTALSVQRRYSGRGNPELTQVGHGQAQRAAQRLGERDDIVAVVSSPLSRARVTAGAVADRLGLPVTVVDGFIETDFGTWEGLTFAEAVAQDPQLHRRWLSDITVAPPGGESFAEVTARVNAATDEVVRTYGPGTVLVVSHVTPIKTVLRTALAAGPSLLYRLHLDLASLSVAEFYPDGGTSVKLVNDTHHLD
ncbi:bifunctional RNase H/acid phosphatase [Williamsia sp. CHRR-6]|uniref:bifunctional RNase H/acid phosphatase n=1 Tax=Williamsia sp. CHRR-6 TaxID=2835871 RepID=UPI0027DE5B50|nr:bifunctional RNase H/acid phosphatase [Williamsia sp. CHRR-6]